MPAKNKVTFCLARYKEIRLDPFAPTLKKPI